MTQETATVARLDYSKPPPNYTPHPFRSSAAPRAEARFRFAFVDEANATVMESLHAADEEAAIAGAWLHYATHNDPPGTSVECVDAEARAAAWARLDSTAVVPEFEPPHVCAGCIGGGLCDLELGRVPAGESAEAEPAEDEPCDCLVCWDFGEVQDPLDDTLMITCPACGGSDA